MKHIDAEKLIAEIERYENTAIDAYNSQRAYDGDRLPRIDWSLNRLVARFEEGIFYLDIRELYKLPGFKENESHE